MTRNGDDRRDGHPASAFEMIHRAQHAHHRLSQMADRKALVLMALSAVIFAAMVGGRGPHETPLPLFVLGVFALATAVLAMLAVLPPTHPPRTGPVNLLFFGSFARLSRDDYITELRGAAASDETVFDTVANDIWQTGRLLARRKVRLLGFAYRVFLVGLATSFAVFLLLLL